MSSVQTGQLISLLINNVLMVLIVVAVALAAWLRWHWMQAAVGKVTHLSRRRCRWAYVSFVLTAVALLEMLASLGILALRSLVVLNALVIGAMGLFLLSVLTLFLALGIWFIDLCLEFSALPIPRRTRLSHRLHAPPVPLLPAMTARVNPPRRRVQRRQRLNQ
ncbi:hypothetical protein IQ260_18480 [Leptolyngbya cf. ectocarpi LEGE 11479]|uniref:Uncharacterized protein n=1 Tax=Leptolyngbya cf. ectocarpi LEGE 11479 TaxID=1828722 RepID=A0A928ZWA7_LEPEC|nr:hypothetical protein [Leptolyngbya ectocarpi]MBE9068635.1 hypothetical protein [Leptolyngbya cf. ectocarpi LEGE 11479]